MLYYLYQSHTEIRISIDVSPTVGTEKYAPRNHWIVIVICITCRLCCLDSLAPIRAAQYCRLYEWAGNQRFS